MLRKSVQLVAVALTLIAANFAASAWAGDKDKTPLEGVWKGNAEDFPLTMTITGNKWKLEAKKGDEQKSFSGTFKIDAKKEPATMDLEVMGGTDDEGKKFTGKTALAIYKLEGDKLHWCANEPGREQRPTEFRKGEGSHLHVIFERTKK